MNLSLSLGLGSHGAPKELGFKNQVMSAQAKERIAFPTHAGDC